MQTRRTNNLTSQHIFDIISDDPDGRSKTKRMPSVMRKDEDEVTEPRRRRRVAIERELLEEPVVENSPSPVRAVQNLSSNPMEIRMSETQRELMESQMRTQRDLVETQKSLIEQLKIFNNPAQSPPRKSMTEASISASSAIDLQVADNRKTTEDRFLVLDTESFRIETELGKETVVPLQIAWAVYRWSEKSNKLELLVKRACYISEIMCTERFREAIQAFSRSSYLKHEAKMKSSGYPLVTIREFLGKLSDDISEHKVQTMTAYNISWDLSGIANLMRLYDVTHPMFDSACDNPLNPMRILHIDLMHEIVKKYGRHLIKAGIKDGTVSRSPSGTRIMLKKDTSKYTKSVFSAEYVLQHFFKVTQRHVADDDVADESLILERIIQDFGVSSLEFGVFYPQRSVYHAMMKIANEELGEVETDDESPEKVDVDDELAAAILESLSGPKLQNKVVCLFNNAGESD